MGKNRKKKPQQRDASGGDVAAGVAAMTVSDSPVPREGSGRSRGQGSGAPPVEEDFPAIGGGPPQRPGATVPVEEDFPAIGGGPRQRPGGPVPVSVEDDFPAIGGGPSSRKKRGPPPVQAESRPVPPPGMAGSAGPPAGARPKRQEPVPAPEDLPLAAEAMEVLPPPQAPAPVRSQHQPEGNIKTVTQKDLTIQHYQSMDLVPPKRPGYGSRGARKIQLNTNHFTINMNLKGQIQHYDVVVEQMDAPVKKGFNDRPLPKGLTRRLMDLVGEENKAIFAGVPVVYDGVANLYTPQALQLLSDAQTFIVARLSDRGNKDKFSITLKWVATIALSDIHRYMKGDIAEIPQNAVNAIDNVFRQNALSRPNMIGIGRSFYIEPTDPNKAYLGEGREIWMGYFQSARISNQKSLTLNVDITATTFYPEQNCVTFVMEFLRVRENDTRPLKDMLVQKLRKEMSGLKVEYKYGDIKKQRKITTITLRSATNQNFTVDQDTKRQMSVAKYFLEKHKIALRAPYMPCVQVGRRDGQTYIPMELCTILGGQRGQRKMTPDQTSSMIKRTAMPPHERQNQILQRVRESNFGNDPYTKAFGIGVNPAMVSLGGRVLQPPTMYYDGNKTVSPRAGAWDPKFLRFYKSTTEPVKNWGMVSFCDRTDGGRLQSFLDQMCAHAGKLGVTFTPPIFTESKVMFRDYNNALSRAAKSGCTFLVCVLPGNNAEIYGQIKHWANVTYGIMTQCLKANTVGKCNPMLLGNVLQKINAKLGGVNHIPHDEFLMRGAMGKPTIIFGADVTHPGPGDKMRPSIAAVVASMDRNACKYESRSAVQAHRKEIIVDLATMVKELLMAFFRNTKKKPEKIVFYRDGVSEGQFLAVLNEELRAVQKACTALQADYKPGITFVIVQKRHHTRFFPTNPNDGEGKHRNVPAGTCVDHGVTHPTEYDFFLCSHAGIQGTSKPAHYHVLWDDNRMSADDLQALSFYLCHCYSNCSRSVSIPAPVYYADKLAAMAGKQLDFVLAEQSCRGSSTGSDSSSVLLEPTELMKNAVKPDDKLPKMFFL